jgi:hypothetical protein
MVAKEVGKSRADSKRMTAEQFVTKVSTDPSAVSIIPMLLNDLDAAEPVRLLVRVLPEAYLSELREVFVDDELLARLSTAYADAFDGASDEAKKAAADRYVDVLREEVKAVVDMWELALFQPDMLAHLSQKQAEMVKTHLIARAHGDHSVANLRAAHGISGYLTKREQGKVIDLIVNEIAYGTEEEQDRAARDLLENVWQHQTKAADKVMTERLKTWVIFLRDKGRTQAADSVDELRAKYEDLEDMPF